MQKTASVNKHVKSIAEQKTNCRLGVDNFLQWNKQVWIFAFFFISESFAQVPIAMQFQGIQLQNPLQLTLQAEQIRSIQLQNEQSALQLRQMEEQRRAQEQRQQSQNSKQIDPIIDEWLKAAGSRMGLYQDFAKVVFSPDVAITTDMIRLMTPSPLAADIAYYLGSNKIESLAISKMTLPQAAKAIDQIESRLKASNLP